MKTKIVHMALSCFILFSAALPLLAVEKTYEGTDTGNTYKTNTKKPTTKKPNMTFPGYDGEPDKGFPVKIAEVHNTWQKTMPDGTTHTIVENCHTRKGLYTKKNAEGTIIESEILCPVKTTAVAPYKK